MANDHIKLRVKFEKYGAIRYIGHLDVMRFFQKCLRRAEIDVCFTTGFSPHQIMSFASPLSVGLESKGEYMDIEANTVTTSQDMIRRMNEASVPGIKIVSVKRLPEDAGNAMASVAAASYNVSFREGRTPDAFLQPDQEIIDELQAFLERDEIPYEKEGKKGMRIVDLKQGIFSLKYDPKERSLHMLVDASSAGNIKPVQIIDAYLNQKGQTLAENALLITREDLYTRKGEENAFLSLDDVGESF